MRNPERLPVEGDPHQEVTMDPVGVKNEKLYQPPPPRTADPKPAAPAKDGASQHVGRGG